MKKMHSLLLCLMLAAFLAVPAFAAYEYGTYYDETEELWTQELQTLAEETIPNVIDTNAFDIRIDVFTSLDDSGIAAVAEYVYNEYEYGVGEDKNGVSLSVYVVEDAAGWYVEDWYVYAGGDDSSWYGIVDVLVEALDPCLTNDVWSGDLEQDSLAMTRVVSVMSDSVIAYAEGETNEAVSATPTLHFFEEGNVVDMSGVLTAEQDAALEKIVKENENLYGCGCYAVVTDDYLQFGEDAPDAVINLYHDNALGVGPDRDGILLMIDVVNRKFAFFVYGENAEYIFDAYGQEQLEKVFLDDLGSDLWYEALEDFALECGEYMRLAEQGEPIRASKTGAYVIVIIAALLSAGLVCFVLLGQMKSVAEEKEAVAYVSESGLTLTERMDIFVYKTTSTRDLSSDDDDSSGSSGSFSGGGGSGRSGSF
ncbi:MAG: TPM domain-containing protein [Oscillospiraceae bacterium]|nr:TPM domain-containing protein [Oscillospiraceae bacterium]